MIDYCHSARPRRTGMDHLFSTQTTTNPFSCCVHLHADDSSGAAGNTSHGEASEGHPRGKGKAGGLIRKLGVIKLRPTLKAAATTVLHGGTPPGVMGRPPLAHHAPGTFVRQLVKEVQQDLAERKEGWSR